MPTAPRSSTRPRTGSSTTCSPGSARSVTGAGSTATGTSSSWPPRSSSSLYVTAPGTAAKYPVETWADRSGDCDDKALLLAGLLAREGYRVALLVFLPESHMALGIGCPAGYEYGGSGYAYLEVTNASYVGVVPDGVRLASPPLVVPIGNGTTVYGAAPGIAAIEAARRRPVRGWMRSARRLTAAGPHSRRTGAGSRRSGRPATAMRSTPRTRGTPPTRGRLRPARRGAQPGGGPPEPRPRASRYDRAGAAAYVSAHPP